VPKIRTNRSAAKRFRRTASGELKRSRAYASHKLGGKTRKRKRRLRQSALVDGTDARRARRLVPYR